MNRQHRVLFIGNDWYGSNATSLRNAIIRCGHDCITLDATRIRNPQVLRGVRRRVNRIDKMEDALNIQVREVAKSWRPDIVFVFKGLSITRETLAECPGVCVHYHPDDSSQDANRSAVYAEAECQYDLHVTTKTFNVPELKSRYARAVLFVPCAYDRDWHLPVHTTKASEINVGFIGTRRPDRAVLIRRAAKAWHKAFQLCGDKWQRDPYLVWRASVSGPQYGLDLSLAVAEAPIQLGLLNSANRDCHTCRSYEIPAAGGVLVAERTDEHMAMLEEGTEALYFSSEMELFDQVARLKGDPAMVWRMSMAATKRIRGGANSYEDRWGVILEKIVDIQ